MTAHDDDQDLVTIRIPRRAAALYAAELDVVSSPLMIRIGLYGAISASLLCLFCSAATAFATVWQLIMGNGDFAATLGLISIGLAAIGSLILWVNLQRLKAAHLRGLI